MKKKTQNSLKFSTHLFYSKNESWWLIGFSMLLAGGIIVEPQLICSALINGQLSDMWLYWSAAIGSAFSVSFFAHLWQKIPVKTENELLLFRFSGLGAKVLHQFRSLYLGISVIPLIISFNVLAFSKILGTILNLELHQSILALMLLLIILTFFNSLRTRLRMDFILYIIFIILFTIIILNLFYLTGGLTNLSNTVRSSKFNFTIIPSLGSKTFNAFLVFISVQWWSANLLDYPDMNGQKLMASKSSENIVRSIFLPSLSIVLFRVLLFTLPFMAVVYGYTDNCSDSELAFTSLFTKTLPSWMLLFVLILFMIPFLSIVQNLQNWGGSLLVENFYKQFINPNADEKKLNKLGVLAMIYLIIAASSIALYSNSLVGITKYLLAITAGVGPVFMLRWYWWRINAWSQLSAMLAALIFPPLLDWLVDNNSTIHLLLIHLESKLGMDYYPIKLIVLTIMVCSTWLTVTFLTKPTDRLVLENFANTIKPGGFWKGFGSKSKSFSKTRILAWLIQSANGFIVYFMFWNFLIGNYIVFITLLLIFCLSFFIAYKLIQKANNLYEMELLK